MCKEDFVNQKEAMLCIKINFSNYFSAKDSTDNLPEHKWNGVVQEHQGQTRPHKSDPVN